MTLIGFKRLGLDDDPDASWTIPSSISADQLQEALDLIKKFEFSPPSFDDGQEAEDLIRRKSAGSRRRQAFDDEDDGIDDNDDEELFPAGGPTSRKSDALKQLKKSRRRRREVNSDDEDDPILDEQAKAKEEARRAREYEKQRKIKSALYVHDSDEASEDDTEFYAREEELRKRTNIAVMKTLLSTAKDKRVAEGASKKRDASAISDDSNSDDEIPVRSTRRRSSSLSQTKVLADVSDVADMTDTPISSPHIRSSQAKRLRLSSRDGSESRTITPAVDSPKEVQMNDVVNLSDDDDEDDVPVVRKVRKRMLGFLPDSSDED